GLEINETGKRRFLLYEPENNRLETREVVTPVIYFRETMLALPVEDEILRLQEMIKKMIEGWEISGQDLQKVKLRLRVRGFTKDKEALSKLINEEIARHGISFYDEGGADLSELKIITDESEARLLLLSKIQERLQQQDLRKFLSSPEDVLEEAAEIIFGGK
ncbi:MAG: hypothetical protein ACPLRA_05205, partial [Candidatus Saccharicenans sp.]